MEIQIREMRPEEIPLLKVFLYESLFQRDGDEPFPRSEIEKPELSVFIEGFGREDDHCLVALDGQRVVGAAWTRIMSGPVKGYGYIDDETPAFVLSLYKEYRGRGVGTRLMEEMLQLLRAQGYKAASLAVQKENRAARLYQRLGFTIVDENEEEYIMVYSFR